MSRDLLVKRGDTGTARPRLQAHQICRRFLREGVRAGMSVLDVGCGMGGLMQELERHGAQVFGIELDHDCATACAESGLRVAVGRGEWLPFANGSLDAAVCSVVLPYTDEREAISEIGRVLRHGGFANLTCHGLGYGLHYAGHGPGWKRRFYGVRMLVNTAVYQTTGYRLPRFLGDTLCQTPRRLAGYMRGAGLELEAIEPVEFSVGMPRFICVRARKH